MASTTFTEHLGLCTWNESDRPKRIDFVNDNKKIDEALGEHLLDNNIHVTKEEKERYGSPYNVITYVGDGAATKTIALDDEYTFAIVFQKNSALEEHDSSGNTAVRFAVVGRVFNSNADITLKTDSIVVKQDTTPTDNLRCCFNEQYGQYVVILFR